MKKPKPLKTWVAILIVAVTVVLTVTIEGVTKLDCEGRLFTVYFMGAIIGAVAWEWTETNK